MAAFNPAAPARVIAVAASGDTQLVTAHSRDIWEMWAVLVETLGLSTEVADDLAFAAHANVRFRA